MKYYIDTEFLEGTQKSFFGNTRPTIDLISIGIVAEDGREYYAVSKDFNLKEACNRYDEVVNKHYPIGPMYNKVYWLRENVLKPIYNELLHRFINEGNLPSKKRWDYKEFKRLINKYGKPNKQIAEEVLNFCAAEKTIWETDGLGQLAVNRLMDNPVQFYGYYSNYDWVVFCWLFGKMIDLPSGFPMYCIDLQQILDEKHIGNILGISNQIYANNLKDHPDYPKQKDEHNALSDARFNKQLHEFLNKL